MLIKQTPDVYSKLRALGGMAGDDVLAPSERGRVVTPSAAMPYSTPSHRRHPLPGVYRAAMPNGKYISLLRVMFTDFCKMDCHYCPNSHWVPRRRYAFKVEELAKLFMDLHQRQTVAGLFLSSGIAGSASGTTERMLKVVDMLRGKYGFKGYIHMKVMPGTEYPLVEEAWRLGTRLSINMEAPTPQHMRKLSAMKDLERDIVTPLGWLARLVQGGVQGDGATGAVGLVTQLVVGAADESDRDIFQRVDQLYSQLGLKRVYYSAFRPVRYTPLEEHPPTPLTREHRLYQLDWLRRVYRFSPEELAPAFDRNGFLWLEQDPKTAIAIENLDAFPVDVNAASREQLLRVPGVGPVAAQRIVQDRRRHRIDNWRDLQAMGVVRKRAWPFLVFPGHRPAPARQLKLDIFGERPLRRESEATAVASAPATAPCGLARSCAGCTLPTLGRSSQGAA